MAPTSIEPKAERASHHPGLFKSANLAWEEGVGVFKGLPVARVSEDHKTGALSLFVRIPSGKNLNVKPELHYHTKSSHTVVLEGAVSSAAGGKEFTVSAGDYFRCPAGWVHADSGGGGLLFMAIDPAPGNLAVYPAAATDEPHAARAYYQPALFRGKDSLKWEEGRDLFAGVEVAVVSEHVDGGSAMFVRVPAQKGQADAPSYHYHSASAQTLVLEGSVSTEVNGKKITLNAGDYFRAPAGWVHADSHSEKGAVLFMLVDGPNTSAFEAVPVQ